MHIKGLKHAFTNLVVVVAVVVRNSRSVVASAQHTERSHEIGSRRDLEAFLCSLPHLLRSGGGSGRIGSSSENAMDYGHTFI